MNEIIVRYNETQAKIKSNFKQIRKLQSEIFQLQEQNKSIELEKKQAVFEIVVDHINKDEVIQFDSKTGYQGGLHPKDKVRVIRKNKKSVTVKVFSKSWDRTTATYNYQENDNCRVRRVPSKVFGEWVFNDPQFKTMIERNEKLKELLG
jgi:hypothetical protein